jgi:hypothetical protein
MKIPESWGHHADALVACLMAGLALSLTITGLVVAYRSCEIMPFGIIFLLAVISWWAWISRSLWQRWHNGHFLHAAWHFVVALPLSILSVLSTICVVPDAKLALPPPSGSDPFIQQIVHSLFWWCKQL